MCPSTIYDVVSYICSRSACTRQQICTDLNLSRSLAGRFAADLLDSGFVSQQTVHDNRRGRPVSYLSAPKTPCALGIELQADNAYGVVLAADKTVLTSRVSSVPRSSWEARLEDVVSQLERSLVQTDQRLSQVRCIGVGLPGPVPTVNLPSFASRAIGAAAPIRDVMARHSINVPVYTDNSVRLAAFEQADATGVANALYMRVSDGIGAAIVVDGVPRAGLRGLAGELGHWSVSNLGAEPLECFCGKSNCLETIASVSGLCRKLQADSIMTVAARWRAENADVVGEHPVHEILTLAAGLLGRAAGQAVQLSDVDQVILAGSLFYYLPELLPLVESAIRDELLPPLRPLLRVTPTSRDLFAGANGAALWAYRKQVLSLAV